MFPSSYKKFYSVLGVSIALGIGAVSFFEPAGTPTGYVAASGSVAAFQWPVFLFGLFVGAVAVGLMLGLLHHERARL